MKAVYIVENLDCPNCALKIESAIQKLEEIEEASLSYPTKQLHITTEKLEGLLEKMQSVADSVEDGVIISEQATAHLDKAPTLLMCMSANCNSLNSSPIRRQ